MVKLARLQSRILEYFHPTYTAPISPLNFGYFRWGFASMGLIS